MNAHVICLNDFPMCVVIGSKEAADAKMVDMRQRYYDENPSAWVCREQYVARCHWHVRTVVAHYAN
jgi:hypothetical protein